MNPARTISNVNIDAPRRGSTLFPVLALWSIALVAGFVFFVFDEGITRSLGGYYLVPWAIVAGTLFLSPSIYLFYKGRFDLFHPLVYSVWVYIFPVFAVGALLITFEFGHPYVIDLVVDPEYYLPLSLMLVALGFVGVIVGYALPLGEWVARRLERIAPKSDWDPASMWFGGLLLIAFGLGIDILGFVQGVFGFQRVTEIGAYDALVTFLSVVFNVGFIMLWLAFFKSERKGPIFYLIIVFLLALIPLKMGLQGGRSSLMVSVLSIGAAYWYSGRRPKASHTVVFGLVLFLSIVIGIIYGTAFRRIKGSEDRVDTGDYVGQIFMTLDYVASADIADITSDGLTSLGQRIENLSSLGVVISTYEMMEPYEESYGLKNNIYNDVVTAFIPRAIWADKPPTSDARAYSDLYFKYSENSFAITPFGDLYRNFGIIGIPLGMMVFGIYYRFIYSGLIATPEPRLWKSVAYYPLLTIVSYETFYATFIPVSIRVIAVVFISLLIVSFFARKINPER